MATGLVGEDPIDGVLSNWSGGYQDHCFRPSTQVALLAVGVVAIGSVMGGSQEAASLGMVALLGVYPTMAGLFGEDLFSEAFSTVFGRKGQAKPHPQVAGSKHRVGWVHHHGFGHGNGSKHKAA